MTKREEMLAWLKEHQREHELMALGAMKNGGSQRYIQEQNHKAQLVSNIIMIVEKQEPESEANGNQAG